MSELVAHVAFAGSLVEWRGPAPFVFVRVPDEHVGEIRYGARLTSYGWGCVTVAATIAGHAFSTALIPRDGSYMLPVKAAVRMATGLALGDPAPVDIRIYAADA